MTGTHKVLFLRHAKTEYNVIGRITGQMNIPILYDVVLDVLKDFNGTIYSSPLKRCKQTLEILCPELFDSIIYDARLIERNMGIFEGEKRCEMQNKFPEYFVKGKINVFKTIPKGESYEELYRRLLSFYLDTIVKSENDILICGHNHALKILKAILFNDEITLDYWKDNNFENGVVYIYDIG